MSGDKFPKFSFISSVNLEKVNFKDLDDVNPPIIFDTNFLFVTFQYRIDLVSELKRVVGGTLNLYIYEGTLKELEGVQLKGDKNKKYLKLISKMLEVYNFKIIKSKRDYVDDQILENITHNIYIATNDKALKKKIKEKLGKVIYLRQHKYLEIE